MNKQGKDGIEWCDFTWNPVTGCLHGCEYCYAKRMYHQYNRSFEPMFNPSKLDEPAKTKKPQRIFVVDMGDLFGEWVPDEWIEEVFKACEEAPQHKYLFLTKNPDRYCDLYDYAELTSGSNFWYGSTITKTTDNFAFDKSATKPDNNYFLSVEPLLGEVSIDTYFLKRIRWVIIGQQTGPGAVPSKPEWVQSIIDQCRAAGVPVFVKSPLYEQFPIQEWPEGLKGEEKC